MVRACPYNFETLQYGFKLKASTAAHEHMFINHPKGPCLPSRVNESIGCHYLFPSILNCTIRRRVGRRLQQYSKVKGCISTDTPTDTPQVYKPHSPPTHNGQSCQLSSSQLYFPRMHLYGPKFCKITIIAAHAHAHALMRACVQEIVPLWHLTLLLGALWKELPEPMHFAKCYVRMN